MNQDADSLRQKLRLAPHPEGGAFREIYRSALHVNRRGKSPHESPSRAALTVIYFLLERGEFSAFHRVRSDEVWTLIAGGPLELHLISPDGDLETRVLGMNLDARETPLSTVPANWWQAARPAPAAEFALCTCIVAPGFDFADFEMPPREKLLREFPHFEGIICELTREKPSPQ